jgi:hypothetical protein
VHHLEALAQARIEIDWGKLPIGRNPQAPDPTPAYKPNINTSWADVYKSKPQQKQAPLFAEPDINAREEVEAMGGVEGIVECAENDPQFLADIVLQLYVDLVGAQAQCHALLKLNRSNS